MLRWKKKYYTIVWIRHNDNLWFIGPKDKLYQWIEKLLLWFVRSETLLKIDDIIADKRLDKWR